MLRFVAFLAEAKEGVINRYAKLHKDHPMAKSNPDGFRDAMRFAADHGGNHDERMAVAKWGLDGHVKTVDDEDSATVRQVLGRYRGAKAKGLVDSEHKAYSYESPTHAFEHLDEVSPAKVKTSRQFRKSSEGQKILDQFSDHKLGTITPEKSGPMDVYHFHSETHGEGRVLQAQRDFIRPSCGKSTPWCVVQDDGGANYMHQYSKGQGFLYYTKPGSTTPVAAHGNGDGVRGMNNSIHRDSHDIAQQTNKLMPEDSKERALHGISERGVMSAEQWKKSVENHGDDSKIRYAAAAHEDPSVAHAALKHPLADVVDVARAARHEDASVARAALGHPRASSEAVMNAAKHEDASVAHAVLKHPKANSTAVEWAAEHRDASVAHAALGHSLVSSEAVERAAMPPWAAKHKDASVLQAVLKHPKANSKAVEYTAQHEDPSVVHAALKHPAANSGAVVRAARHKDPSVVRAALEHPLRDSRTNIG